MGRGACCLPSPLSRSIHTIILTVTVRTYCRWSDQKLPRYSVQDPRAVECSGGSSWRRRRRRRRGGGAPCCHSCCIQDSSIMPYPYDSHDPRIQDSRFKWFDSTRDKIASHPVIHTVLLLYTVVLLYCISYIHNICTYIEWDLGFYAYFNFI